MARHLSERESALTLAWTGFYWLSNSIHPRRFSFIMLRFALDDYFLQMTKERMLLITYYRLARKKCCKCKGMIRVIGLVTLCPWENQHRLQEVTLKICSKHLLLQLRVRESQQEQAPKQPRYNAGLVSHGKASPWVWLLCADSCLPVLQQGQATFAIPCGQVPYKCILLLEMLENV